MQKVSFNLDDELEESMHRRINELSQQYGFRVKQSDYIRGLIQKDVEFNMALHGSGNTVWTTNAIADATRFMHLPDGLQPFFEPYTYGYHLRQADIDFMLTGNESDRYQELGNSTLSFLRDELGIEIKFKDAKLIANLITRARLWIWANDSIEEIIYGYLLHCLKFNHPHKKFVFLTKEPHNALELFLEYQKALSYVYQTGIHQIQGNTMFFERGMELEFTDSCKIQTGDLVICKEMKPKLKKFDKVIYWISEDPDKWIDVASGFKFNRMKSNIKMDQFDE